MNTNINVRDFARQLADVYEKIADAKCEERAIVDAAKDAGINSSALKKVAKEIGTDSKTLAKKYAEEEQLDMFRSQVGIFKIKGLAEIEGKALREAAE